ncbi:MAG TPA: cytochrome C oxidase subunit IV family protein [Polyangiaceae bacterium]|jgi:cytochrome c oxidase subunit 4|nr:cytochrome C oxidase subunit IV family protein [Polyangiaceae bacterium]
MAHENDPHDGTPQPVATPGTGVYVRSFAALLVLTLTSFTLSYAHLGVFGMPVALAIAAVKVALVALFFMRLVDEPASHRVAGVTAVLFVILLASLSAVDVLTRL